jgi:Brp/Blh family beta-carotene 15,15'-monooxygenase
MGWQVVIAVIALAIGIPHGALDHLVTLPKSQPKKMALFIVVYVAVAIAAVVAILRFNTVGFIFVLFMSAVHFGIGDAAFISEIDKRTQTERKLNRWFYIPAAGFTPVFIPLVNSASTDALASVNPALIDWHQGLDSQILVAVTAFTVLAICVMFVGKRNREGIDLTLLLLLAHLAPPLIAFAVYFGCWHAMRHTARLTLSLPRCIESLQQGLNRKAFSQAVIPGLPALIGTFVVAAILAISGQSFSDDFFWMTLVVVWALTVPHMAVTAKLDRAALT